MFGEPQTYTSITKLLTDRRRHEIRHRVVVVLAVLAAVAACTWAGYEIGLTKGRGWRGAMIDHGCAVVCRRIGT